MNRMIALDVRAWLVWGASAFLIALMARNPLLLVELGVIGFTVRSSCVPPDRLMGIGWLLRFAPLLLAIGVVFNLLTVRSGDRVLVSLPSGWPLIGGDLTWNALAFGVVGALALFVLILIGTTLGALIRWTELARILPERLAPLAVAGSVAWVFLPELSRSFIDIRESLLLRGMPVRGPRTMLPLIVPLLAQGLERAMTTAEVLEARGFGGPLQRPDPDTGRTLGADVVLAGGLVMLAAGAYAFASGQMRTWPVLVAAGAGAFALGLLRRPTSSAPRTRFRPARWGWADSLVTASAMVAAGAFIVRWSSNRAVLGFDPYPVLSWPPVDLVTMAVLVLLATPAAIAAFGPVPSR